MSLFVNFVSFNNRISMWCVCKKLISWAVRPLMPLAFYVQMVKCLDVILVYVLCEFCEGDELLFFTCACAECCV